MRERIETVWDVCEGYVNIVLLWNYIDMLYKAKIFVYLSDDELDSTHARVQHSAFLNARSADGKVGEDFHYLVSEKVLRQLCVAP